jgi:CheY-like chemotaxis protein
VESGLLDPSTAPLAPEKEVQRLIFAAGFSTRSEASEVSGRGIGLNIVLAVVEDLGGTIEVTSVPGRGTVFLLEVPITVAIARVVLFRVGMGIYALPGASVRTLLETRQAVLRDGPEGQSVEYAGTVVPVLALAKVLDETECAEANTRIVIAQSGADWVALTGTYGHLEREVMLKPMGRFFEKLPLVTAAVALEEGSLALVLKTAELVLLARTRVRKESQSPDTLGSHVAGRTALVADDSPVVRDVVAQALRSCGLHVLVACDGEEALNMVGAHTRIDIVVTDIDMPHLDGIGLVRAMRSRESIKHIPVVALSMRSGAPERRAAMEAGMSAYIDKSDFNQALLWQTIRPLVVHS